MATLLQTDVQSRARDRVPWINCYPCVIAEIFDGQEYVTNDLNGARSLVVRPTRYTFRRDVAGRLVCQVDNQDHVDFLIASGNFYPVVEM